MEAQIDPELHVTFRDEPVEHVVFAQTEEEKWEGVTELVVVIERPVVMVEKTVMAVEFEWGVGVSGEKKGEAKRTRDIGVQVNGTRDVGVQVEMETRVGKEVETGLWEGETEGEREEEGDGEVEEGDKGDERKEEERKRKKTWAEMMESDEEEDGYWEKCRESWMAGMG